MVVLPENLTKPGALDVDLDLDLCMAFEFFTIGGKLIERKVTTLNYVGKRVTASTVVF